MWFDKTHVVLCMSLWENFVRSIAITICRSVTILVPFSQTVHVVWWCLHVQCSPFQHWRLVAIRIVRLVLEDVFMLIAHLIKLMFAVVVVFIGGCTMSDNYRCVPLLPCFERYFDEAGSVKFVLNKCISCILFIFIKQNHTVIILNETIVDMSLISIAQML